MLELSMLLVHAESSPTFQLLTTPKTKCIKVIYIFMHLYPCMPFPVVRVGLHKLNVSHTFQVLISFTLNVEISKVVYKKADLTVM